ncbi:hypothetical protein [Streptomyces sp. NPDC006510]|uniref:hypothetical protein n=1 Tax=Streptomyces sp. NPDC006510 TaxID=3155600 RepID=UPI0033BD4390
MREWDGESFSTLFAAPCDADVAYALAQVLLGFEGFAAAEPTRAAEVKPTGVVDFRRVVLGDLHVDGAVDMHDHEAVIILGDLHANTVSADETGYVVVAGTIRARTVYSDGNLLAGNVEAPLAVGEYPDGILGVAGTIRAGLAYVSEHILVAGAIDAEFVHNDSTFGGPNYDGQRSRGLKDLTARLPPSYVDSADEDDPVRISALLEHVEAGGSPFA